MGRKLRSEYGSGHFFPPLLILILRLILGTRAKKKTTLISERGLLLTHSIGDVSPYAATTFSSVATL